MTRQGGVGSARIVVSLPATMLRHRRRELDAFARFCASRIERELGARERWRVSVVTDEPAGYASVIRVHQGDAFIEQRAIGDEPGLVLWEAMCRIEQALRDERAHWPAFRTIPEAVPAR